MRQQAVNQTWEKNSMEGAREALGKSIVRWTENGTQLLTAVPGLSLYRRDAPTQPTSYMQEPSLCVIAQEVKHVLLGDDAYVLDVHHFFDHVCGAPHGGASYQSEPSAAVPESHIGILESHIETGSATSSAL
jgi:hypothetical protein